MYTHTHTHTYTHSYTYTANRNTPSALSLQLNSTEKIAPKVSGRLGVVKGRRERVEERMERNGAAEKGSSIKLER